MVPLADTVDVVQDLASLCRQTADYSPMPMAAVKGDRYIVQYVNPAFCSLAGKKREDLVGRPIAEGVPETAALLGKLEQVSQTGTPYIRLEQEIALDPSRYWSYGFWSVTDKNQRPLGLMMQVRDTTETALLRLQTAEMNQELILAAVRQHELKEIADKAKEALDKANEELLRSNHDLEQFASIASHDMQEPLRMVSGFVELLGQRYGDKLDDKAKEYIAFAVDGAKRMSALISDLLRYSRAGGMDLVLASTSIDAVLGTVLINMKSSIVESGADITHDPLPTAMVDVGQFTQLLQNLIGNAIKFRGADRPCRVHVSAEAKGNEWVFSVRDNGIGIDPQFKDRIFAIFERLHGRDEYEGTGIGLAICRKIVERHGGRIWVESTPGEGSVFFFTIPASSQAAG